MNEPLIVVKGLGKTFHVHRKDPGFMGSVKALFVRRSIAREAVKGVTFEIGEGEIVGLVGANGAGKTTLVKMLAGIIHPTTGEARVLGHVPWHRQNALRRQIALIMGQKAQLWWDLPAADCFLLLKEIYEVPEPRFRETLEHLAAVLDVKDQMHVQFRRLSLGERMKMELIAALLHSPRVVYLDEPTIGLDVSAQRAIREFLLKYQQDKQPAMILTSHYMEDIERLCKRLLIIRDGEIVYNGSLEQVVRRYARYKVLTAHPAEGCDLPSEGENSIRDLGEVMEFRRDLVRLHVPRDQVARAAAALVDRLPIVDLNIEEEEIGSIIEKIMKGREGS